jgi:type II secretory ATPase GspE/PulE/Tfp pilus assembly ATPase PilB-like protein
VWHNSEPLDRETGDAILEVVKTLSALDRNERRKRQAGKFFAKYEKFRYTCRVTSQGTEHGERAVLALDPGKHPFHTLSELGMRDKVREQFLEIIGGNRGFVLFASLPADGLTTSIDVSLEETDRLLRHFVAVEDEAQPEPEIENVEVTTFKRSAQETPATVLPKLVRTYPDVIVVRDLRDAASVEMLCKQVEENRLIIGSVRATSAADALLRILALKVSPAEFAEAVTAVLYSRLIRKLCEACKVAYEPAPELLKKIGITPGRVEALYREPTPEEVDKVCTECGGIGYFGRTAMFELLQVNDAIRQILAGSPQLDLVKKAARAAGMRSLQEEGILLVAKGVTSLPELMRALKQ